MTRTEKRLFYHMQVALRTMLGCFRHLAARGEHHRAAAIRMATDALAAADAAEAAEQAVTVRERRKRATLHVREGT